MMNWPGYVVIPIFLIFIISTNQEVFAGHEQSLSLTFGVYQTDKATIMYRKFVPVIEAIQNIMSDRIKKAVDIKLRIFKTYQQANDAIIDGTVDFVRFGPSSYIIAKNRNPKIKLLAMEHKNGKKIFQGVIITLADSPINSLVSLKNKTFAFGDKNSTIGRYLVQAELVKAGVYKFDLAASKFLDRHDIVAKAVALGDFHAGSIKKSTFVKYNKAGQLKILHSFDNITKPWIAREELEPIVYRAIQQALFAINDPIVLKDLKISGFLPTNDEEYDFVRNGMKTAELFDKQN